MGECRMGTEQGADRKNRFILVVNPDVSEQYVHSILLQRFGYNTCGAKTVAEAKETIAVAPPALVVSGFSPGSKDGAALLSTLRMDTRTASTPIVMLLPAGDTSASDRCTEEGAAACLGRPVMPEVLYQAVQAALEPTPRKNIRIEVRLPVKVNGKSLDCDGGECASILSVHGMYVRTLNPSPAKSQVSVHFQLQGRLIAAEAVVLYRHSFGEGPFKQPGMGLRFERISPQDEEFILAFIRNEMMTGLKR